MPQSDPVISFNFSIKVPIVPVVELFNIKNGARCTVEKTKPKKIITDTNNSVSLIPAIDQLIKLYETCKKITNVDVISTPLENDDNNDDNNEDTQIQEDLQKYEESQFEDDSTESDISNDVMDSQKIYEKFEKFAEKYLTKISEDISVKCDKDKEIKKGLVNIIKGIIGPTGELL